MPLEDLVEQIAAGVLHVQIGKIFHLDEIVEAHRCMEENKAGGEIVILTKSCGAIDGRPQLFALAFTIAQITFGVEPWPQILPALLIDRSNGPALMAAPTAQLSIASFTHSGTGIVRMWPPFPLRSAMTQWPSRSWRSSKRKVVTSALRRPQPMRSESKA